MTFLELFKADVRIERDLPYLEGSADPRHVLDVYAPREGVDGGLPVMIYFYGGGWRSGDKRLFEHLGRACAVRGIVAVVVNYRLTPEVRFPAHAEDCAAATRWVYERIADFGGDPRRIVITGHSAGAHLAAELALDARFIDHVGVPREILRGFVVISGVYDLGSHVESTVFTRREWVEEAFGATPAQLAAASPMTHIHDGLPSFLVVVAEEDPPALRDQGKRFADALRSAGNDALFLSVKGRDHFSIVRRFGPSDDTTANAVAQFVHHVAGREGSAEPVS